METLACPLHLILTKLSGETSLHLRQEVWLLGTAQKHST